MIITVQRNEQSVKVTYDLSHLKYPDEIRGAVKASLLEWGCAPARIAEIFNEDLAESDVP